jgi:hypothetical protein
MLIVQFATWPDAALASGYDHDRSIGGRSRRNMA